MKVYLRAKVEGGVVVTFETADTDTIVRAAQDIEVIAYEQGRAMWILKSRLTDFEIAEGDA